MFRGNDAGVDREKLDGWLEKGILALVLAVVLFGPLATGAVETWQWLIVEGLTAGATGLWVARLWLNRRPQLLWPPVCWAVLAFVTYAAVRYFQADVEYVARREVLRILVYALLFFIIVNNLHGQDSTRVLALTPVFLGMVVAIYACVQFVTKSDVVWNLNSNYHGRGSGTFIYPNSLAAWLEMLLPLALSFALVGRLSHIMKILLGYAGVVMLAGVCASLSRGGLLVTVLVLAALSVLLLTQRGYRLRGLALAVLMAGAGAMLLPQQEAAQRVLRGRAAQVATDDMRYSIWQAGLEVWHDHLWLGAGPAHFDTVYRQYRPAKDQRDPDRVHNEYINLLADWGIVGGVVVAAAWALLAAGVVKSWKFVQGSSNDFARKSSNKFALAIGATVGLLGILLHSFLDFNLHVPAVAIWMVTLMAMLSTQCRFATERFWANLGLARKLLATVFLLGGLAVLGYAGTRAGREDYWLGRAAREPDLTLRQQAALERAFAIEPLNPETVRTIGDCYRTRSLLNESDNPDALANQALAWYRRGIKLDPYNPYNWTGSGMCLDWINAGDDASKAEAARDYVRADVLDPNGCFTATLIGRHYMETGDYAAARSWLERSLRLEWVSNDLPREYLASVEARLANAAARNKPAGPNGIVGGTPETH